MEYVVLSFVPRSLQGIIALKAVVKWILQNMKPFKQHQQCSYRTASNPRL